MVRLAQQAIHQHRFYLLYSPVVLLGQYRRVQKLLHQVDRAHPRVHQAYRMHPRGGEDEWLLNFRHRWTVVRGHVVHQW